MDYELSDAHKLIRDTAQRIAREKVAPRSAELDETRRVPGGHLPDVRGGGPARA